MLFKLYLEVHVDKLVQDILVKFDAFLSPKILLFFVFLLALGRILVLLEVGLQRVLLCGSEHGLFHLKLVFLEPPGVVEVVLPVLGSIGIAMVHRSVLVLPPVGVSLVGPRLARILFLVRLLFVKIAATELTVVQQSCLLGLVVVKFICYPKVSVFATVRPVSPLVVALVEPQISLRVAWLGFVDLVVPQALARLGAEFLEPLLAVAPLQPRVGEVRVVQLALVGRLHRAEFVKLTIRCPEPLVLVPWITRPSVALRHHLLVVLHLVQHPLTLVADLLLGADHVGRWLLHCCAREAAEPTTALLFGRFFRFVWVEGALCLLHLLN